MENTRSLQVAIVSNACLEINSGEATGTFH